MAKFKPCNYAQLVMLPISLENQLVPGSLEHTINEKEHTLAVLAKANEVIEVTEKEKSRAAEFLQFGIKPLDALHLALAEAGKADNFCTCDDRLLRSVKKIKDLSVKVVNPVDLVQEIGK